MAKRLLDIFSAVDGMPPVSSRSAHVSPLRACAPQPLDVTAPCTCASQSDSSVPAVTSPREWGVLQPPSPQVEHSEARDASRAVVAARPSSAGVHGVPPAGGATGVRMGGLLGGTTSRPMRRSEVWGASQPASRPGTPETTTSAPPGPVTARPEGNVDLPPSGKITLTEVKTASKLDKPGMFAFTRKEPQGTSANETNDGLVQHNPLYDTGTSPAAPTAT